MRAWTLLGQTLRDAPAGVDTPSHRLLLRAGYLRAPDDGIAWLPLGLAARRRLLDAVSAALTDLGAVQVDLPEDPLTLARVLGGELRSHRQLPQLLFQERTLTRDPARPRRGLLGVAEHRGVEVWVVERDPEARDALLDAVDEAIERVLGTLGLETRTVAASPGPAADDATARLLPRDEGEPTWIACEACGRSTTLDAAAAAVLPFDGGPQRPSRDVPTPGARTIDALAACLGVPREQTAKALLYEGRDATGTDRLVLAMVRGDQEASPAAVAALVGVTGLRPAREDRIRAAGMVPGFASSAGVDPRRVWAVADTALVGATNLVIGANQEDVHKVDAQLGVDFVARRVGPLAAVPDGAPCPDCGGVQRHRSGVLLGDRARFDALAAEAKATWRDEATGERPLAMGRVRLSLDTLLAAVVEVHHDDGGMVLPAAVSPFDLTLVVLAREAATTERAEALASALSDAGLRVLVDDRKLGPGARFADAELRGFPLRVVVSDRGLAAGTVEIVARARGVRQDVAVAEAVATVLTLRAGLSP